MPFGGGMSVLSPHLREQKYGRRRVQFSLEDAMVVATPANQQSAEADENKLVLRLKDGSIKETQTQNWNMTCAQDDVITQVYVTPRNGKPPFLAAIINRTQRERQCLLTLPELLKKSKVSRTALWWTSFIFLIFGAIATECGFYARDVSLFLTSINTTYLEPARPIFSFITNALNALYAWVPWPTWSVQTSATFGSMQDQGAITLIATLIVALILFYRSWRFVTIPAFILCLFILKNHMFGYDSAQGAVLYWYAPVLGLLLITGLVNAFRDRLRMSMRMDAICKSQIAQPIAPMAEPPSASIPVLNAESKNEEGRAPDTEQASA
jgi:hypothetical protein